MCVRRLRKEKVNITVQKCKKHLKGNQTIYFLCCKKNKNRLMRIEKINCIMY